MHYVRNDRRWLRSRPGLDPGSVITIISIADGRGHPLLPQGDSPQSGPGKEVSVVDRSVKIEDFHSLLTSDDSALLTALRELTAVEKLGEIVAAVSDAAPDWTAV